MTELTGSHLQRSLPETAGTRVEHVPAAEVQDHCRAMAHSGARLADFFGALEEGQLVLRLVYGLDAENDYLIVETSVDGQEYPELSDVVPACFVEECEIYEQFSVRPQGPKLLNRLMVPPYAGDDFPRLGARLGAGPDQQDRQRPAPHNVTGEAFEFPFGPVRAVAQESLYMGLVTSGEEVLDIYLMQWHKHRAIERRLQGLTVDQALFIVERAEGLSAVANAWAFCHAAETISGYAAPDYVERQRGVALELERLYNHAGAVAAMCQATGLSVAQAQAELALEQLLRLNLASFGHRYLFGVIAAGGTGRCLQPDVLAQGLPNAYGELRRVIESLWVTNSFMDRLETCGSVSPQEATRLGLVGPVARASGRDLDTRRDHPFGPFAGMQVEVPTGRTGDALARMQVMAAEAEESVRLALELCAGAELSAGTGRTVAATGPAAPLPGVSEHRPGLGGPGASHYPTSALGWCESPRGESLTWLCLDADGRVERARVRPGSARNWRAFDDAARSRNVFTDIPIIEASFWLTVAGLSR